MYLYQNLQTVTTEITDLNPKVNTVLPIVLALVLPGLSVYANPHDYLSPRLGLFGSWISSSISIYLLWYILWYLFDTTHKYPRWWFIVALLLFYGIAFLLLSFFVFKDGSLFRWITFFRLIMGSFMFLSIQYAMRAQQNISRLHLEKEQIQTENYRAQLKALRAKIDPHFLFNSLNTLRSMVRQKHDNSEEFIVSLSDFYRQTLKHEENATIRLSEELAVLQSYLFVMKNRNADAICIKLTMDEAFNDFHLPTLALQVVVENCFKHNSMTSKRPLHIEIFPAKDNYIEVRNNIQPKIGHQTSSGFGLDILKKRYALMNIPEGVIIEKTPQYFSVKLKLI